MDESGLIPEKTGSFVRVVKGPCLGYSKVVPSAAQPLWVVMEVFARPHFLRLFSQVFYMDPFSSSHLAFLAESDSL